jgi:dihydrolipoamide dehydrogenase
MTRVAIEMPKVNFEMESGVVHAWTKKVGDRVQEGEVICEIETEKVVVDLVAPASGVLVEIVHAAGDEVPSNVPIAWLETAGQESRPAGDGAERTSADDEA